MNGKYAAFDVACYIVNKCIDDNEPISNLQLQKILYYCQIEYYEQKHELLFSEEFRAWKHGPVIPDVYYKFRIWGRSKIILKKSCENNISDDDKEAIDKVVEDLRKQDAWYLVEQTHQENTAWSKTYKNGDGLGQSISNDLLIECGA